MKTTTGILAAFLCTASVFGQQPTAVTAPGLEKFAGIPWGASLAEAKALHPEMRCLQKSAYDGPETVCSLSPDDAKRDADYKKQVKEWKAGKPLPHYAKREPAITIRFQDGLTNGQVRFWETEYAVARAATIEKYGKPLSAEVATLTNGFGAQFKCERLSWVGEKAAVSLKQFEEIGGPAVLSAISKARLERSHLKRDEEKAKVKEKF